METPNKSSGEAGYLSQSPLPVQTLPGSRTAIISDSDLPAAEADVKKLKVPFATMRMIITGDLKKDNGKDRTRAGRDMSILCSLVYALYSYETARAIFTNKHLGCSDRILENLPLIDENLRREYVQAIEFVRARAAIPTPQVRAIIDIKANRKVSAEKKLLQIRKYVVKDLFENVGAGYENKPLKRLYVFDRTKKMLLELGSDDFRYFLRARYDLPEKDMSEVLAGIGTEIKETGTEMEPFNFARYDTLRGVLYISNHDNRILRLDGEVIELVDNGTDGIIFEYKPEYAAIDLTPPLEGVSYFDGGFDWNRFKDESLLFKHLINLASFDLEEKYDLQPEEQRYLLTLYFYSLFFESLLEEKPIICFTGVKASGKGLISTAIGKIVFGPAFMPGHLPENIRDFQVALLENYYLILDNVDSFVRSQVTDALCRAATGERISMRKLYTDSDEIKMQPRVFLSITSRDPRFKRDDFVDRLMIFKTAKIKTPRSRTYLFKSILEVRQALWAEILINLNLIVKLLRTKRDWNPPGIFRIADWELWGKKVHDGAGQAYFTYVLDKMNREKAHFGLEEDPLYIQLRKSCFDHEETISETAAGLHARFSQEKDFAYRYKNSISLGKRLHNVKEELGNEFDIKTIEGRGRSVEYIISAKKSDE